MGGIRNIVENTKVEDYWGDLNGDGIIKLLINRVLVYGVHSGGPGWG